jgi:hypothetical protein
MRIGFVLLACAILANCNTTPNEYASNKSRTYDQSFDETWDHAIRYLSEHDYTMVEADKENGIIRASVSPTDTLKSGPKIAECSRDFIRGSSAPEFAIILFAEYDLSYINLNMLLVSNGPTTKVTVDTRPMYMERARCIDGLNSWSCKGYGECVSRGVIETQILSSL